MNLGLPEQLMLRRLQELGIVTTKYVKEVGPMTKQFMVYILQHKAPFADIVALRNKYPNHTDKEIQFIIDKEHLAENIKSFIGDKAIENDNFEEFAEFLLVLTVEAADDVYLFNKLLHQGYTETGL